MSSQGSKSISGRGAKNVGKGADAQKTGVVLVTHADFGHQLLQAAAFILGPQEHCQTIAVEAGCDVEETLATLRAAAQKADEGQGVLLLTDMFGGTPTNLSLSLLGDEQVEVVTGMNLPMLLKVLTSRHLSVAELAVEAKRAGAQGIVAAGELLRKKIGDG